MPYTPGPQPNDAQYTNQTALNLSNLQSTQAELRYDAQRANYDYGFNAQGGIDPTNPYSRAAGLLRAYNQGQSGTLNSMAAGGQLYSSGLQRNLDEGTHNYGRDSSNLRQQYVDYLHGLVQQGSQAQSQYTQGNIDARGEAIQRAQDNRPEDPGAPDYTRQYARLDNIRGFLHKHPNLRRTDPQRYARLIREANQLKSTLPSRY